MNTKVKNGTKLVDMTDISLLNFCVWTQLAFELGVKMAESFSFCIQLIKITSN